MRWSITVRASGFDLWHECAVLRGIKLRAGSETVVRICLFEPGIGCCLQCIGIVKPVAHCPLPRALARWRCYRGMGQGAHARTGDAPRNISGAASPHLHPVYQSGQGSDAIGAWSRAHMLAPEMHPASAAAQLHRTCNISDAVRCTCILFIGQGSDAIGAWGREVCRTEITESSPHTLLPHSRRALHSLLHRTLLLCGAPAVLVAVLRWLATHCAARCNARR